MENVVAEATPNKLAQEDGSVLLKLVVPIDYGENKISEIVIKRPKGKHLRGVNLQDLGNYDILSKLVASCSDLESTKAMDEMDISDIMMCIGVITDFL